MLEIRALERALQTLGDVLMARGLSYRLLTIGGSTLLLMGLGVRPTADVDIVGVATTAGYSKLGQLPDALATAVYDVAQTLGLADGWLNTGPADLMDFGLPEGFEKRISIRRYGGLELHLVGRTDQLCFKLYAAVDQGPRSKHFADLQRLGPSREELMDAARWTRTHDPSIGFRDELRRALLVLGLGRDDAERI